MTDKKLLAAKPANPPSTALDATPSMTAAVVASGFEDFEQGEPLAACQPARNHDPTFTRPVGT